MKTRVWRTAESGDTGLTYACQGCGGTHSVRTSGPPPVWAWNGDRDRPVLSPSVLVTIKRQDSTHVCHTFIGCNGAQPGEVIFLPDCTHAHAGQVLPLPDLPDPNP